MKLLEKKGAETSVGTSLAAVRVQLLLIYSVQAVSDGSV